MLRASRTPLAVLASLTLVLQLAGLAHEALAPHVVCAEHGEWVDGDAGASPARAAVDAFASAADQLAHASGHEHCAVVAHRRAPSRTSASAVVATSAVVAPGALPLDAASALGGLSPLDVAPKASPPAIG